MTEKFINKIKPLNQIMYTDLICKYDIILMDELAKLTRIYAINSGLRFCPSDSSSLRPKKKKSLVPVGCQLRSWVGREFILFFYFIFSSGSE